MKICSVEGCTNKVVARGWCKIHWQKWRRYGDPNFVTRKPLPPKCEVPGCSRKPHARWNGQALCGLHYLRVWSYGSVEKREQVLKEWAVCCVDGCDKPARSPGDGSMCEMHYYRKRRTGTTDIIPKNKECNNHSSGYILSYRNVDHPVATRGGYLYEHRRILFDEIGWGPHKCFWCGRKIDWMPGERNKKGSLVVDHFNGNKADNTIKNLLASCHRCNCLRGLFQRWVSEHGKDAMRLVEEWSKKRVE